MLPSRWRRRQTLRLADMRALTAALVVSRAHGWRCSSVHRVDAHFELVLERRG